MTDAATLAAWWQEHRRTGGLPAAVTVVQQRLVRAVGRGQLPSGPVFVKVMAFPRWQDRLRYLVRALPGAHEAAMLQWLRGRGIPCPEVVAVRTARRHLVPHRSMLVLRALPVVPSTRTFAEQMLEQARLAVTLLATGCVHRDLNLGNFVTLADGRLAVLDLQSARRAGAAACERARIGAAARLLGEHVVAGHLGVADGLAVLRRAGLLRTAAEETACADAAERQRRHWLRGRIRRCLLTSTEYSRVWRWNGIEHRRRGPLPPGRWHHGDRSLRRAWLGQRALQVMQGREPRLPAFFASWSWLPCRCAVYVPESFGGDCIQSELQVLSEGFDRYRQLLAR